jgi:hypothetical protein
MACLPEGMRLRVPALRFAIGRDARPLVFFSAKPDSRPTISSGSLRMLRYHLDDLGPYQFEKLAQSALKASVGLGVESWGNRGDWGRDSYARGPLRFPDPKIQTAGPFIFQAKFIEGANSAGSRPSSALISSAHKEVARILERVTKVTWKKPAHFIFITNSLVDANDREKIRAIFQKAMASSAVHVWGAMTFAMYLTGTQGLHAAFPNC